MHIKYMYKIHCLDVANGVSRAPGYNNTFYETEERALQRAQDCIANSVDNLEMVVYRAAFLVRQAIAPVEIIPLDRRLL